MPGNRTILFTAVCILISNITLGNPENRCKAAGPISIVFLPDIQYNDPYSDADGLNLKMDQLLNTVAASNPLYVIIGNQTSNQIGSNPIKESVIYQSDIYYPNWMKQVSKFDFTWYTVFNENNLGGDKWQDHKSVIFETYQDQYQKYFKMPRTGGGRMVGPGFSTAPSVSGLAPKNLTVHWIGNWVPEMGKKQAR